MRRRAPPNPAEFKCWQSQDEFNLRLNAFLSCASRVSAGNRGSRGLCDCYTADPIPGTIYGNFWYCVNQLECAMAGTNNDIYTYLLQNLALPTNWGAAAITTFVNGKTLRDSLLTCGNGATGANCNKDPTTCTGVLRSTSQCLAINQCGGTQQPVSSAFCQGGCAPTTTPCTVPICTTYSCSYQTVGVCQGTCGPSGQQSRIATCTTDGTNQVVATSLCGATCTSTTIPCPALPCCPSFSCQVAPFTVCTSSCGDGQRTAVASCVNTCGGVQSKVALSACTTAGVPCETQSAPCTVCPSLPAVYVPGPAVTIQGTPVTVQGAPVYVQGAPVYVQGTAPPVAPTYNIVPFYQTSPAVQTSTRYIRDSRGQCIDTAAFNAQVSSTLCPTRRSRHSAEDSQTIPYIAALSASGGIMVVIAFVATGVVLVRRTVRKRVELHLAAAAADASQ